MYSTSVTQRTTQSFPCDVLTGLYRCTTNDQCSAPHTCRSTGTGSDGRQRVTPASDSEGSGHEALCGKD